MSKQHDVTVTRTMHTKPQRVWKALTDPDQGEMWHGAPPRIGQVMPRDPADSSIERRPTPASSLWGRDRNAFGEPNEDPPTARSA